MPSPRAEERVELDLGGRDATHIRTSPDGEDWSDWSRIRSTPTATIRPAEGEHEVFAQFRNGPGLKSPVVSDSIVVDRTPPEVSAPTVVAARGRARHGRGEPAPVTVRWEARDATAGLSDASGRGELRRRAGPCAPRRPARPHPASSAAWDAEACAFPDADCDVTAIAVDGAGNTSPCHQRATSRPRSCPSPTTMSATVSGSQFGVIARRGPDAGRMAVLLDGEALGLVDLWAESDEGPAVVFVAELPPGEHTVSVEPTDGSDTALTVDGFATLEPAA